jgi:integrase/recombinase XerD
MEIAPEREKKVYTLKTNKKRFMMPKEWMRFLNVISRDEHKFFFEFLLHTGMRYNEACNVQMQDIDFERETIFIRKPKRSDGKSLAEKQRTIQISTYLKNRIQGYLKSSGLKSGSILAWKRTGTVPSIQFIDKYIKKYCKDAGFADWRDFSCHTLRKTCEMYLVALNINTMAITVHLGHTISVAESYYISNSLMNAEDKTLIKSILDNLLQK